MSSILRTAGGGGVSISSMLRIGGLTIPPPPLVPGRDRCLGAGGSTSNMLLTGDRGVLKGEPVRAEPPEELAEPLGLPFAEVPSRIAKTSFRSSSNTASMDIGLCAMIAVYVYPLRCVVLLSEKAPIFNVVARLQGCQVNVFVRFE